MLARVLIIDDSVVVRHFVKMLLAGERGIGAVLEASSADEAWLLLDTHAVDVITLDLNLPDVDGLRIIEPLRIRSGSDVIILSGNSDTHPTAMALGATACFEKDRLVPDRAAFIAAIQRAAADRHPPAVVHA